ncbi:MAG: diguanylate cyclase [Myxococcota bacterium]|nr:diguanylate cyclase [Myxococcota bacterium]
MTPEWQRPQRSGLSTKILVFVFCSVLATALLVSGLAVHSLYAGLAAAGRRSLASVADAGAESIAAWSAGRPAGALPGPRDTEALVARLASARPPGVRQLLLVDAEGRVLAAALREAEDAPERVPARAWEVPLAGGSYQDESGLWMVAVLRPVGETGWRIAAQTPFQEMHEPVIHAFTRLFVVDLVLVLVLSLLAYRMTILAVRPIEQLSDAARRIAQGQFDHEIPEPDTRDEIGLLARTFNDMMRRLRGYQSEIEAANASLMERNNELRQAKETFEQLSITDGLTKLHNHRFFQDHLTREIKRVDRTGEPLAMLLVDIDDFKGLNDRFGHAAGDELLAGMARIMNDTVRESDLLARYGGEEFVVLCSNTDLEGAYSLAEKVRTAISETSFILDDSLRPTRVTVSIGVAQFRGNRKEFFQAADRALYRAKDEGKNCVVTEEDQQVV